MILRRHRVLVGVVAGALLVGAAGLAAAAPGRSGSVSPAAADPEGFVGVTPVARARHTRRRRSHRCRHGGAPGCQPGDRPAAHDAGAEPGQRARTRQRGVGAAQHHDRQERQRRLVHHGVADGPGPPEQLGQQRHARPGDAELDRGAARRRRGGVDLQLHGQRGHRRRSRRIHGAAGRQQHPGPTRAEGGHGRARAAGCPGTARTARAEWRRWLGHGDAPTSPLTWPHRLADVATIGPFTPSSSELRRDGLVPMPSPTPSTRQSQCELLDDVQAPAIPVHR